MRILFVIDSLRSGGKERRLVSLINGFKSYKDIEMELILLSKEIHYKSIFNTGIKIHFLQRDLRKDIRLISKFTSILNFFKPELVHGWDNIAAIHFAPICKLKGIPFINSMITAAPKVKKFSKRYITNAISYPFSDIILSNSQAGLDSLYVPKRKQRVIYNGFNFKRIKNLKSKEEIYEKFNIQKGSLIVGMVASFTNHKDYTTFIKAGEEILKRRKDVLFIAIGDGYGLDKIKDSITKDNIKSFYFLGKQIDVESIINLFDIGVLMSNPRVHGEGISNAIIEYMALKKPVIASKGGGTSELIIDRKTGFLIEPKNSEELLKKINYLLEHPKEMKEMGLNGRGRIESHFNIIKMISETYLLYKTLI